MTKLDDFFAKPPELLHPRLRNWKLRLEQPGMTARVEVFRPERDLGLSQPEMYLHFRQDETILPVENMSWDDDLNSGLVILGVKAISHDNEALRFSLGLRGALRKAEREFGDGYFNGVLVDLLRDSDLTSHSEIADIIKDVHANSPHREGGVRDRYNICRELIADAIAGRANELTKKLGYTEADAKGILVSALANYLDERFSISSRRRLGWL
jgi:hypothetical protein